MDVPPALKQHPNWILWKHVGADNRKVPFQASGQPAKSNDPETWTAYEIVAAKLNGTYAGIGYVFHPGDGIFGIDLDGCIDASGAIQPWALEILREFATYAEISPSGTGVKLWAFGKIPGGAGKKKNLDVPPCCEKAPAIEVYGQGRYFTFTGRKLPDSPNDLNDCQEALERLFTRLWPAPVYNPPAPSPNSLDVCERALRYVAKLPPAISGQGGHNATFRAACVLVLGFDLSPERAFPVLAAWNQTHCQPAWNDKELWHKLGDANKKEKERGWILRGTGYTGQDPELRFLMADLAGEDPPEEQPKVEAFPVECIDEMPHLMRLAYDYAIDTAIKPQPELTLAALVSMFGAVFGRKVRDDYGTRTNIMMLGLSPSGSGKEHPRQVVKKILYHAKLDLLNGPERVGSHAGIVSAVAQYPVRLFQLDEIGRLLATMRDPRNSPHLYNVGTVLMQLYSSSGTIWIGDAYADPNKTKRINQPCVCVFGTSVPDGFYAGLSAENLSDGLLGRMIVLESGGYGKRRKPKEREIPQELIDTLASWDARAAGNLQHENPEPLLVEKTSEASERHERYCDEVHNRHPSDNEEAASIWARAPEKEAKLALIYACCEARIGPPVITLQAVNWARRLVNYATRLVIQRAGSKTTFSRWAEEKSRAWKKLDDGMSMSEFTRKTQWLKPRERQEILIDWEAVGAVRLETIETKTKPKAILRKLRNAP